ncbi:hypothetical protein H8F10_12955 [Vibrio fluvialis]|uniref:hypothetical protein n=1 Tax=Vibrio fluvialis TaxID=676 RepID=UPI00192C7295|nr:hypothetical protein [Vibrio fluvialis]MBL4278824.1 hypothetical protein [Vibrio fluvialis]
MKETIRIELTQGQYQQLKEIGVSNSEIKSYGCTHPSSGVTIDHYMTIGVKKSVTGGNQTIDNIDTTPIQVESLAGGAEWKNGDECTVGSESRVAKFVGYVPDDKAECFITYDGTVAELFYVSLLRKPETEAERNERERLEAAYDLYLTRHVSMPAPYHYDEFLKNERTLDGFLAIVDKTGYRKAVTNE